MKYVRTVQNTEDGTTTVQSRTEFLTKRPFFYRTERPESGRINISDGTRAWSGARQGESDIISPVNREIGLSGPLSAPASPR